MPRSNTYKKYRYTAELWRYENESGSSAGSVTKVYSLDGPVEVDVIQSLFSKLTVIFKEEDAGRLQQSTQLFYLSDADGQELYPGGIWTMQGVVPVINIFGKREGFRGEAKLTDVTTAAL